MEILVMLLFSFLVFVWMIWYQAEFDDALTFQQTKIPQVVDEQFFQAAERQVAEEELQVFLGGAIWEPKLPS